MTQEIKVIGPIDGQYFLVFTTPWLHLILKSSPFDNEELAYAMADKMNRDLKRGGAGNG